MKSLSAHLNESLMEINESFTEDALRHLENDSRDIDVKIKAREYLESINPDCTDDEVDDLCGKYCDYLGTDLNAGVNTTIVEEDLFNIVLMDAIKPLEKRIQEAAASINESLNDDEVDYYASRYRSLRHTNESLDDIFDTSKINKQAIKKLLASLDSNGISYTMNDDELTLDISSLGSKMQKEILTILK